MMQAAMNAAMKSAAKPGAPSPFGAPGANPFAAAGGASPFGASPFPTPTPSAPVVDTTATTVTKAAAAPAAPAAAAPAAAPAAPSTPSTSASSSASSTTAPRDGAYGKRRQAPSGFADVNKEAAAPAAAAAAAAPTPTPTPAAPFPFPTPSADAAPSSSSSTGGSKGAMTVQMLEQMVEDPKMLEMMYPYLPEPMRNKETFKWMLSNPVYRKQLEDMMEQQVSTFDPSMQNMMSSIPKESQEAMKQMEQMGINPSDVSDLAVCGGVEGESHVGG